MQAVSASPSPQQVGTNQSISYDVTKPERATSSANTSSSSEKTKLPVIIRAISVFLIAIGIIMLFQLAIFILFPHVINNSMLGAEPQLLSYVPLQLFYPYFILFSIVFLSVACGYIYLGFKIRDRSTQSWQMALWLMIVLFIADFGINALLSRIMALVTDNGLLQ